MHVKFHTTLHWVKVILTRKIPSQLPLILYVISYRVHEIIPPSMLPDSSSKRLRSTAWQDSLFLHKDTLWDFPCGTLNLLSNCIDIDSVHYNVLNSLLDLLQCGKVWTMVACKTILDPRNTTSPARIWSGANKKRQGIEYIMSHPCAGAANRSQLGSFGVFHTWRIAWLVTRA